VNTNEYLDAAKEALDCATDAELASRLGVVNSRISNYRRNRSIPNAAMARTIARALKIQSGKVIADMRQERESRGQKE
jgi:transcriptional regulator with XRE-family HTH domain